MLRLLFGLGVVVVVVVGDVLVYDRSETLVDEFNDLPARFGPIFPLDGLHAYAIMSSDVHGCADLDPPPRGPQANGAKFVVLMARNNCTFFEKVINAERAGYDAAIVYNTLSDDLVEMSGDSGSTEDARIPSMFIGYFSAMEIKNNYVYDPQMQDMVLVMNRNLPFNINTQLLWPFVGVVVLCFLSMIVVTIVKCIRHRNRVQRDRLPQRELRKLPVIRYNPATSRYETCSICLDDYVEGERLRVLPCAHTYHTKCVDPWLTKGKRNCPLCKKKIRYVRRTRRSSDDSDTTSSSSSNDNDNDTTPLLNSAARNAPSMGTFPEGVEATAAAAATGGGGEGAVLTVNRDNESGLAVGTTTGVRGFFSRLFRGSGQNGASSTVNERENMLPSTVSAVVDMTPPDSPTNGNAGPLPPPPPPYSVNPPPYSPYPEAVTGVIITTPISSPLRRSSAPSREVGPGTSSSVGTVRIGVAALPNVNFQGGGGVAPVAPQFHAPPPTNARQQPREQGRHNRRRRRGHEDV